MDKKYTRHDPDYDVVIVGGGMVGSMLAAALSQDGRLKVAVLERREPEPFNSDSRQSYDIRVSALSVATQRMFENVDAWQGVTSRRACPYTQMLVWDGEEGGKTHFQSSEIGASVLGHIVENRVVQLALLDRIKASVSVDYLCPCQLGDIDIQSDRITCRLSSEAGDSIPVSVSTRLLVGADGARSRVRDMAGIATSSFAYPHHALVATIETDLPQQDITWQRFRPTGPEAFLPLCGKRASMVWYHSRDEIERLESLTDEDFADAMQNAFPARLGGVRTVLERASFPIARAHAKTYLGERIALIGDAAHSVHPLAGQGVNLGMLDAAALAEVIINAQNASKDIGSRRVLRRYERWRQGENAMMIAVLDGFYHAFKPQPALLRTLRSTALTVADNAGLVKRLVMQQAMGTGPDLPLLAR